MTRGQCFQSLDSDEKPPSHHMGAPTITAQEGGGEECVGAADEEGVAGAGWQSEIGRTQF